MVHTESGSRGAGFTLSRIHWVHVEGSLDFSADSEASESWAGQGHVLSGATEFHRSAVQGGARQP